ncbi:MAG: ornithine cyclodeaminase family protein [Acidimicrobiales bacterium]
MESNRAIRGERLGWSSQEATICLSVDDLVLVINEVGLDSFLDELIAELRDAMEQFDPAVVKDRTRSGFSYESPSMGLVEWMPSMTVGDVVSVKTVGYHPDNPNSQNLPSVLATTALYDTVTGRLLAICEGTLLTALRTGAASAVMTDATVRPGPITLGVVGCGAQAVTQIHAISRVRDIERLVVTDADGANARSLVNRLPAGIFGPGSHAVPEVLDVIDFCDAVENFDVLCTCTTVEVDKGPVVDLKNVRPGLHINAVGSDFPGKVELPVDYLQTAVVIPDVVEQCLVEGESQQLSADQLGPDMVAVLTDPANRELVNQRTVFDSTGWSYEDQIAAKMFLQHATRLGVGTQVRLQHTPVDPYDPYEVLRG